MIKHLQIKGYKSIQDMEIELHPINVLIGANGAGKSNLISFLKLLKAISNQQLQRFVLEEGKADDLLYFGRKHTEILSGKLIFSRDNRNNNGYKFELTPTKSGGLFIKLEASGYNVLIDDDTRNYINCYNSEESEILDKSSQEHLRNVRNAYLRVYISGIQIFHFHDTSSASQLRKSCDVMDNKQLKSDGRNLPAVLYLLKEKHPIIYRRILKVIKSVAPFIEDFILEINDLSKNGNEIALRWIEKTDPESNFSAHQFSDGTLRFIALTTALLHPEPPSIIIIDEPELGLHPFAISKLAGLIKIASTKAQIIISTQSVNLVDCFDPDDIITVDRERTSQQSVFRRLDNVQFSTWLEEHKLGELWQRDIIDSAQPFIK